MTCDNRPRKGAHIKVEPIRYLADIKRIKNLLVQRPRDMALFTLGINMPLRVSDLLSLTYDQVARLVPGAPLVTTKVGPGGGSKWVSTMSAVKRSPTSEHIAAIHPGRRQARVFCFQVGGARSFCHRRFIAWSSPGAKPSVWRAITVPIPFAKHGAITSSPPSVPIFHA